MKNVRIGQGWDTHRLVAGRRLILGGMEIDYEKGLLGHSDADVLTHAIIDAILGALALDDIGRHYPDDDPDYKDIDSTILLLKAAELLVTHGYLIGNIDATIICQQPKLAPYIVGMRSRIGGILGTDMNHVSIKATTREGMGSEGRGEAITAMAVVLIYQ